MPENSNIKCRGATCGDRYIAACGDRFKFQGRTFKIVNYSQPGDIISDEAVRGITV